jgi:hypothetical protein
MEENVEGDRCGFFKALPQLSSPETQSVTNVLRIAWLRDETRTRELPKETELTFQQQSSKALRKGEGSSLSSGHFIQAQGAPVDHRTELHLLTRRLSGSSLKSNLCRPLRKMPFY